MVNLATLTDHELDDALQRLYLEHAETSDRLPTHLAIMDVLAEQGRRTDEWIAATGSPTAQTA